MFVRDPYWKTQDERLRDTDACALKKRILQSISGISESKLPAQVPMVVGQDVELDTPETSVRKNMSERLKMFRACSDSQESTVAALEIVLHKLIS